MSWSGLPYAKNVDPGDIALRLFLQKQFSDKDCEAMLLSNCKNVAPLQFQVSYSHEFSETHE